MSTLQAKGLDISSTPQGIDFDQHRRSLMEDVALTYSYWRQRLRDHQVRWGDLPSTFMFHRVKQRKRRNQIFMLRGNDGSWVEDQHTIAQIIVRHFETLYTPVEEDLSTHEEHIDLVLRELHLPRLSEVDVSSLLTPFSDSEIESTLFGIANDKSPGLDGFPAEFFKVHWVVLGPSISQAIHRFLSSEFLLKAWNCSLVVLIPKTTSPETVSNFRPISLCYVVYECASKCLVNRIKPLLPKLIGNFQNAFVPGRQMSDNVLILHDLVHTINKQHSGSCHLATLKLDMNKAYDHVSWTFLLKVLNAYGFPTHWIKLLHQCISTVTYRILINGTVTAPFVPKCGLRQGDPLPLTYSYFVGTFSRA